MLNCSLATLRSVGCVTSSESPGKVIGVRQGNATQTIHFVQTSYFVLFVKISLESAHNFPKTISSVRSGASGLESFSRSE